MSLVYSRCLIRGSWYIIKTVIIIIVVDVIIIIIIVVYNCWNFKR